PHPAIRLHIDAAADQSFRIDQAPIRKTRAGVQRSWLLDEGALIDRREKPGTSKVPGDNAGDVPPDAGALPLDGMEARDGDRQRLHEAARNVDRELCSRRLRKEAEADEQKAKQQIGGRALLIHPPNISLGSKFRTRSCQMS